MRRRIEYGWRLRELMAARGMNTISDLLPHLADRGIELSASQIYRLVGAKPERMNLTMLGALLDTLDCSFEELCPTTVESESSRTRSAAAGGAVPDGVVRPARARIRKPE